jgi:hypothetical protein
VLASVALAIGGLFAGLAWCGISPEARGLDLLVVGLQVGSQSTCHGVKRIERASLVIDFDHAALIIIDMQRISRARRLGETWATTWRS